MEKEVLDKNPNPSLLGMFWSPGEQFERIRQKPLIWIPLMIVTILYIVAYTILAMSLKAEDLMLPGMTLAEAEMVVAISKVTTAVSGFFAPILTILISSIIYLIIVKIAKKDTTFKQLFSMNTYIIMIGAVGILLNYLIIAATGESRTGTTFTSLAGLFNSQSSVLGTFELFSIWQSILTAIGLHKVGQLSKATSIIIVILFFLFSLGIAALGSVLSGLAGL
ncbi:YIP1 family protein [Bacillus sp. V3B]|uniref:YIP1 family protein n=1 Tax=Bacillus sp. V3B TaxID=2804915 RepID=UPI00210BD9DB|nr:YIP1 family protein [Bacillus sp. V3B]MCQ6276200.1 YIP1 family protein [Bacillus sp. V3B]